MASGRSTSKVRIRWDRRLLERSNRFGCVRSYHCNQYETLRGRLFWFHDALRLRTKLNWMFFVNRFIDLSFLADMFVQVHFCLVHFPQRAVNTPPIALRAVFRRVH